MLRLFQTTWKGTHFCWLYTGFPCFWFLPATMKASIFWIQKWFHVPSELLTPFYFLLSLAPTVLQKAKLLWTHHHRNCCNPRLPHGRNSSSEGWKNEVLSGNIGFPRSLFELRETTLLPAAWFNSLFMCFHNIWVLITVLLMKTFIKFIYFLILQKYFPCNSLTHSPRGNGNFNQCGGL